MQTKQQTSTGTGAVHSPSGSMSRDGASRPAGPFIGSLAGAGKGMPSSLATNTSQFPQQQQAAPFAIQISNKQNMFEGYAGYDGQGGFHGKGGHGGDQHKPHKMDVVNQKAAAKMAFEKEAVGMNEMRQPGGPQGQAVGTLPTKQFHSNREQRAVRHFQPTGTGKPGQGVKTLEQHSPERFMKEFKQYKQAAKGLDHNGGLPSAIDFVVDPNALSHPPTERQQASFQYSMGQRLGKEDISINKPSAGYGNFGPQMITQEQTYGDPYAKHEATNRSDAFKQAKGQHKRAGTMGHVSITERDQREFAQSLKKEALRGQLTGALDPIRANQKRSDSRQPANLFTTIQVPTLEFEHRASNAVHDEKKLMNKLPSNPQNQQLLTDTKRPYYPFDKKSGSANITPFPIEHLGGRGTPASVKVPIFQQSAYWCNYNEQSIASNRMNESAVRSNKYISLPHDPSVKPNGNRAQCELLAAGLKWEKRQQAREKRKQEQSTLDLSFNIGLSPLLNPMRVPEAPQIGTVRTLGSMAEPAGHGISKFDQSQDVSKDLACLTTEMPSKLETSQFEDSRIYPKEERSIMITDQETMNQVTMRGATNRTLGSHGKAVRTPSLQAETMKDLEHLHMYDSLLLSDSVDKHKKRSPHLRTQSINVGKLKMSHFAQTASNNKFDLQLIGKFGNAQASPRSKYLAPLHLKPCHSLGPDRADIAERHTEQSSNQSNVHQLVFGNKEIETMKGTKINQLSPLTRKMNQQIVTTADDLDGFRARLKIREEMKQNLLQRMRGQKFGSEPDLAPHEILARNSQMVKILRNELKSTIAPDEEKYQILQVNNPNYQNIEILPDLLPVYIKVPCANLKSPCQIEILMENVEAVQMLISTEHKFPSEENTQFEREKLFVQDAQAQAHVEEEMKRDQRMRGKKGGERRKTSLLMLEASSKIPHSSGGDSTSASTQQRVKRKLYKFAKAGYKDYFLEDDILYISFVSQYGGTIKAKALFPNNHGGFGPVDILEVAKRNEEKQKVGITEDQILDELDRWCAENLHLVKNMMSGQSNFVELNKADRLQKCQLSNFVFEHQKKMFMNHTRREAAHTKAQEAVETKWDDRKGYLTKWEDYRESKINLTHIFIKVLKRKNFTRRWLIAHKVGQIYAKVRDNLYIRRTLNYILHMSSFVAIRFKWVYKQKYCRMLGLDMDHRRKNEIRRILNFGAIVKHQTIISDTVVYLGSFIFKTFLIFDTCKQFTRFNDNLIHIQNARSHLLLTRQFRFQLFFERLEKHKDFMVAFYGKKKNKKVAQKISKNLKKIFNKNRVEDFKMIKSQLDLIGRRNQLDDHTLYYSIKIRGMCITHQIMALSKKKDEEGNQIYKDEIADIKTMMDKYIKKIKFRLKQIGQIEIDLYGLPDKEIKEVQKVVNRGRKPTAEQIAMAELHKYDTAKLVKDDKTEKACKEWLKKEAKKKKEKALKAEQGADDGKDGEDGEGAEGEDAGEGMGEGDMDGEGDGEGADGEGGEGAEGENAEGAEGAEAGEAGEKEGEDGEGGAEGEEGGDAGSDAGGDGMDEQKEDQNADGEGMQKSPSQAAMSATQGPDGAGDTKSQISSPKKGKGKSLSKGKKKKSGDENKIEIVTYKPSKTTKGRMILGEKVPNPPEILEYIQENYEEGVNSMNSEQIHDVVDKMYRRTEKMKLIKYYENLKLKPVVKSIHRFLLHLAVNIGPQAKINEDIEENLKEEPTEIGEAATQALNVSLTSDQPPLNQTFVTDQPLPAAESAVPQSETPDTKDKGKGGKLKGKSSKKADETSKKTPGSNKTPTERQCARHGGGEPGGNSQQDKKSQAGEETKEPANLEGQLEEQKVGDDQQKVEGQADQAAEEKPAEQQPADENDQAQEDMENQEQEEEDGEEEEEDSGEE